MPSPSDIFREDNLAPRIGPKARQQPILYTHYAVVDTPCSDVHLLGLTCLNFKWHKTDMPTEPITHAEFQEREKPSPRHIQLGPSMKQVYAYKFCGILCYRYVNSPEEWIKQQLGP